MLLLSQSILQLEDHACEQLLTEECNKWAVTMPELIHTWSARATCMVVMTDYYLMVVESH